MTNIYAKLMKAQQNMGALVKSTDAYRYKYATLADSWHVAMPALNDAGLVYFEHHEVNGTMTYLVGTIADTETGDTITGKYPVVSADPGPQPMGSANTYARRYVLNTMMGQCPVDDDGQAAMPTSTDNPFEDAPTDSAAHMSQPASNDDAAPPIALLRSLRNKATNTTPASAGQYKYLAGTIDKLFGGVDCHKEILSFIVEKPISQTAPPSKPFCTELLNKLLEQHKPQGSDEWVDNPMYDPVAVELVKGIYKKVFNQS